MSATYRFVGEVPEVFPDLTGGRIQVAGANHDPNAADFQQPGELRPGQEFTGPDDLVHARVEVRWATGSWEPTTAPPADSGPAGPPAGPPAAAGVQETGTNDTTATEEA